MQDIQLVAMQPNDMIVAQNNLISWCEQKLTSLWNDVREFAESLEQAKKYSWKTTALENQHRKAVKRVEFYKKVKAALESGYHIVPNFPIDFFAIKTNKKDVVGISNSTWSTHEQSAQQLPQGEGEYKNPFPLVSRRSSEWKDGKEIMSPKSWAEDWDDLEFPITMAKPEIIEATSIAMQQKIFDRIGIMPATRKEDPVIIGQVIMKQGYNTKIVLHN